MIRKPRANRSLRLKKHIPVWIVLDSPEDAIETRPLEAPEDAFGARRLENSDANAFLSLSERACTEASSC